MKTITAFLLSVLLVFGLGTTAKAQHYVQKGETLSLIAKKYNMKLNDLISLNPHIDNPNIIHVNDYIIIRSKNETKKDMVAYAQSLADITAYKYGGQDFPYSTDCSGFTQGVFAKFGVELPRTSREQAYTGTPVTFQQLELGDLMFFSTRKDKIITHVGINMGNDLFISNLNEEKDVEVMTNWGSWAQKFFMWGARYEM